MTSARKFNSKIAAAVLGGALLSVTFAGAASAAPVSGLDDQPVSFTIHKSESQAPGSNTNPTPGGGQENVVANPVEGVEFTVQQITSYNGQAIDLTDSSGWAIVDTLKNQDLPLAGNVVYGTPYATNTDSSGRALFNNLEVGLYVVSETGNPGGNNIVDAAKPFLVTLPSLSGVDGDSDRAWNYDVHAYPKNSLTELTKELDDQGAHGLGDEVSWTVEADVPRGVPGGPAITQFQITDKLDSRLEYVEATVFAKDNTGATINLAAEDYTLNFADTTVTLDLTASGLAKINSDAFRQGTERSKIGMVIDTKVIALGDGNISNTAELLIENPDNVTEVETDPVTTQWGGLTILKHSGTDENVVLQGAEFQIFASESDANSKTNPIAVNGVSTFVTGANGEVDLEGLKAGGYWLVETKAPTGYIGQDTPIAVTITPGSMAQASTQAVSNSPITTPVLPPLGSAGMITLMILGGGAVVGGSALAMRGKLKKAES